MSLSLFFQKIRYRYIPAKFSVLRERQALTELKINFKITLQLSRAHVADEYYYRYRAIIRILLRCLMQFRVIGFAKKKKIASGIKREQSLSFLIVFKLRSIESRVSVFHLT